jgi:phosphate transport system substrate-binding protein
MAPLMAEIGKRFEALHPDVRIDIEPTSSARAINDTRLGLADLGMLGRAPRPEETGFLAHPVARDGLAILVHRSNRVRELTPGQIAGVFTRYYVNWKEVGGPDRPIVVVSQAEGRAAREVFLEHFGLRPPQLRADPAVPTSGYAIDGVARHRDAIGYASLGPAERAAREKPIRLLPLAGVPATLENVSTGRYPLVRTLHLLTREPPRDLVKEFLDFARSADAAELARRHGFLPGH